jgi:hypothetical protein
MSLKTQSAVLKEEPEKRVRIPGFANLIGCSVPKVRCAKGAGIGPAQRS